MRYYWIFNVYNEDGEIILQTKDKMDALKVADYFYGYIRRMKVYV